MAKGIFSSVEFLLLLFNSDIKEKTERTRKRANGFCSHNVNKPKPEKTVSAGSNVLQDGVTRSPDQFPHYSVCLVNELIKNIVHDLIFLFFSFSV